MRCHASRNKICIHRDERQERTIFEIGLDVLAGRSAQEPWLGDAAYIVMKDGERVNLVLVFRQRPDPVHAQVPGAELQIVGEVVLFEAPIRFLGVILWSLTGGDVDLSELWIPRER